MKNESKLHQKPFTMIGSLVFLLVGLLHALRVIFGTPVMVGDFAIPLWVSYWGAIVGIFLAIMLWRENLR